MTSLIPPPPLLAIPREVREGILHFLTLPQYVYTSTATASTHNLHRTRKAEQTYIDTRIYLPSRVPANIIGTCKQLRQECLELHAHLLNSVLPAVSPPSEEQPLSNVLAERLGNEFTEEAERAGDDGTLRITIEVQRHYRGPMGYSIPIRDELSPRFLALLPLMNRTRKLRLVVWPGYDWWSGGLVQSLRRIDKPALQPSSKAGSAKQNAATFAINSILEYLPELEELTVHVLITAAEASRWDLPDNLWEKVQPWLDDPVTVEHGRALQKVTRRLAGVYKPWAAEPFYTQIETRQAGGRTWRVVRKGDMRTPMMRSLCEPSELDFLAAGVVDERFDRTD